MSQEAPAAVPRRRLGALALVLAATLVPVAAGIATGGAAPVLATVAVVPGVALAFAGRRRRPVTTRELALLALAALVCVPTGPIFALWTLLGGLGAAALFRARGIDPPWIRPRAWLGVIIAVVVGVALGAINVAMARGSGVTPGVGGSVLGYLGALRAGLSEEIGLRMFLLGLCVYVLGQEPRCRRQQLLTAVILTVPHAAMHFTSTTGLVEGTIVLSVVFGLPLVWLLRRFGVLSAVVAHTLIDATRYLALGA